MYFAMDGIGYENTEKIEYEFTDIPGFDTFAKIDPITKGYSVNMKYCVTKKDGTKYLLRIAPIAQYESNKALFDLQKQASNLGAPMCEPIDFGICNAGVYSLQSWINGEDLEYVLPTLSKAEQYKLGIKAGEILRKIHSIPVPSSHIEYWTAKPINEDWEVRFNRTLDNAIYEYNKSSLRFDGDDKVINYIKENRYLLKCRPISFGFDDFNVFNMMLSHGRLVIIDFERYNICDPWEEFGDIVWSVKFSPHFATGQICGYFCGEPPDEFFKLLALYSSEYLLAFWKLHPITTDFGQKVTLPLSQNILQWFDGMKNHVPTWYLKDWEIQ